MSKRCHLMVMEVGLAVEAASVHEAQAAALKLLLTAIKHCGDTIPTLIRFPVTQESADFDGSPIPTDNVIELGNYIPRSLRHASN